MHKLLQLKHWQLFALLIGIPMIFEFVLGISMIVTQDPTAFFSIFPFIIILSMSVFFGWFYALGTNLHKKLPETVDMNLTRFRIFLFIPVAYIFAIGIFMIGIFGTSAEQLDPVWIFSSMVIILPLHLFSMFCIFYCLRFIAKSLKGVEWQRGVTFSDYAGEFFLIWFFPVGIWIIQPRINKLFNDDLQSVA